MRACNWLVADAKPGDSLFFHYSGHGGRMKDPTCESRWCGGMGRGGESGAGECESTIGIVVADQCMWGHWQQAGIAGGGGRAGGSVGEGGLGGRGG
jgi:hypothetical protein